MFAGQDGIHSDVWHQDITLERGKRYLISAESGTGKSSMCSYIYGYRQDYSGIIAFDGQDIRSLTVAQWCDVRQRHIAYLPQDMRLFAELTSQLRPALNLAYSERPEPSKCYQRCLKETPLALLAPRLHRQWHPSISLSWRPPRHSLTSR